MGKKVIVWSGISLFVLTLAIAGCERGEREEGDEREHKEEATPPSSVLWAGAVAPAPSGSEASPGTAGGKTSPADKKEEGGKSE